MIADHNFPVGTVLATSLNNWTVRSATMADLSSPKTGIPVRWLSNRGSNTGGSPFNTLVTLPEICKVVSTPSPSTITATNVAVVASNPAYNLAVVKLAQEHERSVGFSYTDSEGKTLDHIVEVADVTVTRTGKDLFGGPDETHDGEYRAFRIDRVDGEIELY